MSWAIKKMTIGKKAGRQKRPNLKQRVGPVRSVGEEAKIRQRLLRASRFSFRLREDVGELDQQLPEALALVRRQCLKNSSRLSRSAS